MRLPRESEPLLGRHVDELTLQAQTPAPFYFHCDLSATGTTFIASYATGDVPNEVDAQILVPRKSTLQNFCVKQITTGTSNNRAVYTVRLNGADTEATISLTGREVLFRQSPKKIKLAAGDLICVGIKRPDGSIATAPSNVCVTFELV